MASKPAQQERIPVGRVAELLGAGWVGCAHVGPGDDGTLTGPGGEVLDVAFGGGLHTTSWVSLRKRTRGGRAYSLKDLRLRSAEEAAQKIASDYPVIAECHRADVARTEKYLRPASKFAAEVAGFLGEGWSGAGVDNENHNEFYPLCVLTCGDMRISWVWKTKQWVWGEYPKWERPKEWQISGNYAAKTWGNSLQNNPQINVGSGRPAKQVANEIQRRLLPGYTVALQQAQARDAEHAEAVTRVNEIAERVQAALGYTDRVTPLSPSGAREFVEVRVSLPGASACGEVGCRPEEGGSVSLNLRHIPLNVAVRMLEILREGVTHLEADTDA